MNNKDKIKMDLEEALISSGLPDANDTEVKPSSPPPSAVINQSINFSGAQIGSVVFNTPSE